MAKHPWSLRALHVLLLVLTVAPIVVLGGLGWLHLLGARSASTADRMFVFGSGAFAVISWLWLLRRDEREEARRAVAAARAEIQDAWQAIVRLVWAVDSAETMAPEEGATLRTAALLPYASTIAYLREHYGPLTLRENGLLDLAGRAPSQDLGISVVGFPPDGGPHLVRPAPPAEVP